MISQRKPITNIITKIVKEEDSPSGEPIYALDSDKGLFNGQETILMHLGKVMERHFTMEEEDFNINLVKGKIPVNQPIIDDDHHRFMKLNNNVCLRSQIDCTSKNPDGTDIVYEIKTRAVAPIRYDIENYKVKFLF